MKSISTWLVWAGFALLIFGGKLWLIRVAGSDLPFWDQWDAEGESVYRPWIEGRLTIGDIIQPHNEHRLVTTKLYALGLFAANGQWDEYVATTTNAAIDALFALALLLLARRLLRAFWLGAFGTLLVLLFTLPFSWQNTLMGFQVQFYFLLIFSLGHIWFTLDSDRFAAGWAFGQVCGVLALSSLASGFFSSVAVAAVLGHRFLRERRFAPQQFVTLGICIAMCILGWAGTHHVPRHELLLTQGVAGLLGNLLRLMAWPGVAWFPWTLALWFPALVFTYRRTRGIETPRTDAILLGLFLWTLLQCAAIAFGRGASDPWQVSRYFDILALNVALGFLFLAKEFTGFRRAAVATVWCAAMAMGLVQQSTDQWLRVVSLIAHHEQQEQNVRAYLSTGDEAHLRNKRQLDIPFYTADLLLDRFRSPAIRNIMPPSVRPPVPICSGAPDAPRTMPSSMAQISTSVAVSTWSLSASAGGFHWRSATQADSSLPVLRFRVAGDLGKAGQRIHLVVRSTTSMVAVEPKTVPGESWETVNIFRPRGEWWVEATDEDDNTWFAFTGSRTGSGLNSCGRR